MESMRAALSNIGILLLCNRLRLLLSINTISLCFPVFVSSISVPVLLDPYKWYQSHIDPTPKSNLSVHQIAMVEGASSKTDDTWNTQFKFNEKLNSDLDEIQEMLNSMMDTIRGLNKSSSSQMLQSPSSSQVAFGSSIFPSLETGFQVADGAGQPSPLKLEGPKAVHNLFDEMPSLPTLELNEVNMLLDELLIRVPVKYGDDVLGVHSFPWDSCRPHLKLVELHLDTLNPWGESESENKNVDDFSEANLYSELAEEDLVQFKILRPCQTAISQVEAVEKFFSSRIRRLEIDPHMFDEMLKPISAVRNKGAVVHGELILLIVGLPRDLSHGSEVTELYSFNISSKSKLEEVSMLIDIMNPELDVDFAVDGMLTFIFDPGGSSLFYNGCDHFESNVERGNYCLATNRAEFLNIGVQSMIGIVQDNIAWRDQLHNVFQVGPLALLYILFDQATLGLANEIAIAFGNSDIYVTTAGLYVFTYMEHMLYAWLGSNDFGYQNTVVQGVIHKNIQCYDCFKPSQAFTRRCDIESLIVGLKKERLHHPVLIFRTKTVRQSVTKQLHKLMKIKMVEEMWKKFLEESESEKDKKAWALFMIDIKQLAMAICAHRLKTMARVKETRKNLFEGVVNAKLQHFVWDPGYRIMHFYILEDKDVLKRNGIGVRLALKQVAAEYYLGVIAAESLVCNYLSSFMSVDDNGGTALNNSHKILLQSKVQVIKNKVNIFDKMNNVFVHNWEDLLMSIWNPRLQGWTDKSFLLLIPAYFVSCSSIPFKSADSWKYTSALSRSEGVLAVIITGASSMGMISCSTKMPQLLLKLAKHNYFWKHSMTCRILNVVVVGGVLIGVVTSSYENEKQEEVYDNVLGDVSPNVTLLVCVEDIDMGTIILVGATVTGISTSDVKLENFVWDPGLYMPWFFPILEDKDVFEEEGFVRILPFRMISNLITIN